ncbi:hypothetical protein IFM89_015480 [Coptis chinensis]|uniref:KIB1-4 beta-propeller domain-containing protein n=1 Tax=Coptis chinensis TaxID=261450 RepID=A0A835GZG2_9MAGN|nr:hypothetical protein IFM89_015480 [Coptis chinensis]
MAFHGDQPELLTKELHLPQVGRIYGRNAVKTRRFKVFKLDLGESKWAEVEYLGNIALFVGSSYSFSLTASDFPGCKAVKASAWIKTENQCDDLKFYNGDCYVTDDEKVNIVKGLHGSSPPTIPAVKSSHKYDVDRGGKVSLVEASSDLLKVVRIRRYVGGYCTTHRFKIFKLDFGEFKWVKVENIGDSALYVALNHSISIVASDFPGCKGDCN